MDIDEDQVRHVKIIGTGRYLPKRKLSSADLDEMLGLEEGTVKMKTGINYRHWVDDETAIDMGKYAALQALERAKLESTEIDMVIAASGVNQQPIPPNSSLLLEALGLQDTPVYGVDVNCSCMSFLSALDLVSEKIHRGVYDKVLIVSTEVNSPGLNPEDIATFGLIGDGAAAVVFERDQTEESDQTEKSMIYTSYFQTFSAGAHASEILGGGNRIPPFEYSEETAEQFLYSLDRRAMNRILLGKLEEMLDTGFKQLNMTWKEAFWQTNVIVPHQVNSRFNAYLAFPSLLTTQKIPYLVYNYGNMSSASLPLGIDEVVKDGSVKRGDNVLLIGGASGISLGMMYLKY